jgi:hypothetical protein
MAKPFLLDTNAYALLFENPRTTGGLKLEALIADGQDKTFYLPEIVAMEIHSVLGKYRRGGVSTNAERCDRHFLDVAGPAPCPHRYVRPARKRMSAKLFRDLQKLMFDIEAQRGPVKATVLPTGATELLLGKKLLHRYADRYSFGSHDAVVAGTLAASQAAGLPLTLVTSDKGLKALSRAERFQFLDPSV